MWTALAPQNLDLSHPDLICTLSGEWKKELGLPCCYCEKALTVSVIKAPPQIEKKKKHFRVRFSHQVPSDNEFTDQTLIKHPPRAGTGPGAPSPYQEDPTAKWGHLPAHYLSNLCKLFPLGLMISLEAPAWATLGQLPKVHQLKG